MRWGSRFRDDALAAGAQHVDLRALLVGRERPLEEVMLDLGELEDPAARLLRRLAGHVLARRVAGRVVEACVDVPRGGIALDLHELAAPRRRLGRRLDLIEMLIEPPAERSRAAFAPLRRGSRPRAGS